MDREQCARATELFQMLDQHDAYIAAMMSPTSVEVTVTCAPLKDGDDAKVLLFSLPVQPRIEGDQGIKAYAALVQIMRDKRTAILGQLRAMGAKCAPC